MIFTALPYMQQSKIDFPTQNLDHISTDTHINHSVILAGDVDKKLTGGG